MRDGLTTWREDGCWTEECDETLQLGYCGRDAGMMSFPPGLRDVFSVHANREIKKQRTERDRCLDKRETRQVADDRINEGTVKISAVAVAQRVNALPENAMLWIPLSAAAKSDKTTFRVTGGDPIPARGERSVTGRTDGGHSRRSLGSLPFKRPLLSVAKITKGACQVDLGEDKAFLRRESNVWMLDLWVRRPPDAMDVLSFQRLGR